MKVNDLARGFFKAETELPREAKVTELLASGRDHGVVYDI